MRRKLFIVLCAVFSADLVIGANNIVLNCPCQPKSNCFKPLDISKVNETSCADENFVRCCGESESLLNQIVVVLSTTSSVSKHADNISVVFPSEMSGIPQTTPINMPDDYMIQMIDRQSGNEMLLVFPKHEETTSEEPIPTTSTTVSPITTTLKTTKSPISRPFIPPIVSAKHNATQQMKPKRISGRRNKMNANKQHEPQAEQKHETPKTNAKIFDASRRKNFLRRHPDIPQEIFESIPITTTQTPIPEHIFNDKLSNKIDQEHKAMIENLKAILTASNDNSPLRRPVDLGKNRQFASFEGLVNMEMEKVIDNMKMKKKPYRGKIKYQNNKWAAIPDSHQEQRTPPKTPTIKSTATKQPLIRSKPKYNYPSLPYNEFENGPTLLADFKPSPLWSLQAENIEIFEVNRRNPRTFITSPIEYVGAESGFAPVVHNGESLQIVGPVPKGFKNRIDDSRISYELPAEAINYF